MKILDIFKLTLTLKACFIWLLNFYILVCFSKRTFNWLYQQVIIAWIKAGAYNFASIHEMIFWIQERVGPIKKYSSIGKVFAFFLGKYSTIKRPMKLKRWKGYNEEIHDFSEKFRNEVASLNVGWINNLRMQYRMTQDRMLLLYKSFVLAQHSCSEDCRQRSATHALFERASKIRKKKKVRGANTEELLASGHCFFIADKDFDGAYGARRCINMHQLRGFLHDDGILFSPA